MPSGETTTLWKLQRSIRPSKRCATITSDLERRSKILILAGQTTVNSTVVDAIRRDNDVVEIATIDQAIEALRNDHFRSGKAIEDPDSGWTDNGEFHRGRCHPARQRRCGNCNDRSGHRSAAQRSLQIWKGDRRS